MRLPSFLFVLVLLSLLLPPAASAQSEAALTVTNGDFSDLEGLSSLQSPGWYSGVPAGWSAASPPDNAHEFFAVRNMGAAGFVANLHVLSRRKPDFVALRQDVGVLAEMSDITLTFDATGLKEEGFSMGAAIINSRGSVEERVIAKSNFAAAGPQRLVAQNVPAGTSVTIQFWAVEGFPGVGNVAIEVTPSS